MDSEPTFHRWVSIPEAEPVRFGDLAGLIARALHTDAFAIAAAERNIEDELRSLVDRGALKVRDSLSMGPHPFPIGDALRRAVLFPWELRPLLEARGIGLRLLAHGSGPERWTIEFAANAIATREGWHQGTRDSLLQRMIEAAASGALPVRDPHTDLPYRPKVVRAWYDLVLHSEVDAWLKVQRVPYRLGDAAPEAVTASDVAPGIVVGGGPRLWELRTAIEALARQRDWSEYERGEFLGRAIKAATTGALVTRNPSLDGAPIRGDRDAAIASVGCYVFTEDLNAWLRDVEKVPHIVLREEILPDVARATEEEAPLTDVKERAVARTPPPGR